jgi:single-stranded-DNA-specific exonuclease
VLVLASANWHAGIIGIIAGRVRERFERPAFVFALQPDGTGIGSGRSMPGVDLGRAVIAAVEAGLIARGGGHAMAAGATVKPGQLAPFRAHLSDLLKSQVGTARALTALKIDAALSARGATVELVQDIERAGPFGSGNPQPVFAFPGHRAKFAEIVANTGHIRFQLTSDDGARLKAIAFRAAGTPLGDALLRSGNDARLHLAGMLSLDHYQGRAEVQLRVTDAAEMTS